MTDRDVEYISRALAWARKSVNEGGVPAGSFLVEENMLISESHNRRQ